MARRLLAGITLAFCLLAPGIAIAAPEARQPAWVELTYEQKHILAPVHGGWDNMSAIQRKRLLGVAKGYSKMKPEEQQRIQRRLKDWSKLTPDERAQARGKFEKLKQLPPEKRQEVKKKWHEYQQLPEEKKEQLRRTKAKPAETNPTATLESPKAAQTPVAVESVAPAAPPKAEAWPNPRQFDAPRP